MKIKKLHHLQGYAWAFASLETALGAEGMIVNHPELKQELEKTCYYSLVGLLGEQPTLTFVRCSYIGPLAVTKILSIVENFGGSTLELTENDRRLLIKEAKKRFRRLRPGGNLDRWHLPNPRDN